MRARPWGGGLVMMVIVAAFLLADEAERGEVVPESGEEGPSTARAEVRRVVDGDTIEVGLQGRTEDVRYIGVDTPETVKPGEPVQCFGEQASTFNRGLVEGERVRLVFDRERRDRFGRLLAYVYVGSTFVNGELVAGGYARTLEIEPNTAMAGELARLEGGASRDGRGLWSSC